MSKDSNPPPALRLIVPEFTVWARARAHDVLHLPGLERAVRRGVVNRVLAPDALWSPWQHDVLNTLNIPADGLHAVAPLEWLGSGGEPRPGTWLRGEFVHVEVGTHAARLHAVSLEQETAASLRAALAEHFTASGWRVLAPMNEQHIPAERFYLHADRELQSTCPLASFGGTDVRDQLPQGRDGPELRRLFTEAQMLLHEHPANAARERARLQPVNAIWFSGAGVMPASETSLPIGPLPTLWSDEPWVRGLAKLHGSTCLPLPADATAWLSVTDHGAAILSSSGSDIAPDVLEVRWFAPLVAAVAAGRIARLELALGSFAVLIDRPALRRFWKRGRSLQEWLS